MITLIAVQIIAKGKKLNLMTLLITGAIDIVTSVAVLGLLALISG